jgi:hypothetical protein
MKKRIFISRILELWNKILVYQGQARKLKACLNQLLKLNLEFNKMQDQKTEDVVIRQNETIPQLREDKI